MCSHLMNTQTQAARQLGSTHKSVVFHTNYDQHCNIQCNKVTAQLYNSQVTTTEQPPYSTINIIKFYSLCTCKVIPTQLHCCSQQPLLNTYVHVSQITDRCTCCLTFNKGYPECYISITCTLT